MKIQVLKSDSKIGIINRGEAAVRFIGALREYNLLHSTEMKSVAFFIEPERSNPFVKLADHAYPLMSFPGFHQLTTSSPYLSIDFLIQALERTECDAVWVGWGFLAEDPAFVEKLEEKGIVLLGPSARSMALLGDKIQAKELADQAQVPTCPWSGRPIDSVDDALSMATKIGYPVILKSANGGGGRGIRKVMAPEEMAQQYQSVCDEIQRFFGNQIVFMEALVQRGRHLEVQTVADGAETVLTFGVRDCSVQRNNQKIIEETPPANLSDETVAEMEAAAKRLLLAAGYKGAATVEFLYDMDRKAPFFMEVNTRLQVEHPITENLYAVDLVMMQIMVASGQTLSGYVREEPRGHVIEVRLNAEDPENNFAPTPGKVHHFKPPQGPGIRVDTGIETGRTIPREFDSMVAKIIAQAPTRALTVARLKRALQELRIEIEKGTTNKAFLMELLNHPEVAAGGVQTSFVEKFIQDQNIGKLRTDWEVAFTAAVIYQYRKRYFEEIAKFNNKVTRFSQPRGNPDVSGEYSLSYKGEKFTFHVRSLGRGYYHVQHGDRLFSIKYSQSKSDVIISVCGKRYQVQLVPRSGFLQCEVNGVAYPLEIGAKGSIVAPSPSVVLSVNCKAGQEVKKGERLMSLEAMKMEMVIASPEAGVVKTIHVLPGQQVAAGQAMVEIEPAETEEAKATQDGLNIDFSCMALRAEPTNEVEIEDIWYYLRREYLAHFLGHDAEGDSGILDRIDAFVAQHPTYKKDYCDLIVMGMRSFITIENLFTGGQLFQDQSQRELRFEDLMVHYLLRKGEDEEMMPESFRKRIEEAMQWYSGVEFSDYQTVSRVLFHINRSHANRNKKEELVRHSLSILQRLYPEVPHVMSKDVLADVIDGFIMADVTDSALVDMAFHTRYELIGKEVQQKLTEERNTKVAGFLTKFLQERGGKARASMMQEIVDSGQQIVNHLASVYQPGHESEDALLTLIAKRFNRDRKELSCQIRLVHGVKVCEMNLKERQGSVHSILATLDLERFFAPLDWLQELLAGTEGKTTEVLLVLQNVPAERREEIGRHICSLKPLARLFSLALQIKGNIQYRSFVPDAAGEHYRESLTRRTFSPLRYRELRIERMRNFKMQQVYHSGLVHVMYAVARENPKDERLFAFVEIPETQIKLDDKGFITRVIGFEDNVLDAIQAMRREQAKRKKRLFWNRIIVHIGHVHPLKLDQIGQYPKLLTGMIRGIGLEKIVIYTQVVGKRQDSIDAEVLFENISTKPSLRGRLPSSKLLKPLDEYNAKVLRCIQRDVVYPYETLRMITNDTDEDFPQGRFEEYDLTEDGDQRLISVAGRPYGQNKSNIVFGKISSCFDGKTDLERVIILGDPSGDLGSLAEPECRRVIAAIDMAEKEGLPIEWIPISSGAAIGMNTGTENLDWTAQVLRRIVTFTQQGGEINVIVAGINVGAQSYWNAEATMMMHNRGVLIMTEKGSMLLTGKKALDFSGSVSAEDNIGIGGAQKVMGPNGQAQYLVKDLVDAYRLLFRHYKLTYCRRGARVPQVESLDPTDRNVCHYAYVDPLGQGFANLGDILGKSNAERKKPFDMRQILHGVRDQDSDYLERWGVFREAETAIVWETRLGGTATCLIGIESRPLPRLGELANDGPDSWNGGTLYPQSSRKIARAINAASGRLPVVVLANLSGFDGSPESLRNWQLEYGAEIGRAVVNFEGPIVFCVISRYHGGAYVVFSKTLNPNMITIALEKTYASVIGGAPAAAVVFPRQVMQNAIQDPQMIQAEQDLKKKVISKGQYKEIAARVRLEHQARVAQEFEKIHTVERAKQVGSIDHIISADRLRPFIIETLRKHQEI